MGYGYRVIRWLKLCLVIGAIAAYPVLTLAIEPEEGAGQFALWLATGAALGFSIGRYWAPLAALLLFVPVILCTTCGGQDTSSGDYSNEALAYTMLIFFPLGLLSIEGGYLLRRFASGFARPS